MRPAFVLLHSPVLGPLSWRPAAAALSAAGYPVVVPSLLGLASAEPPFWPWVLEMVRTDLRGSDRGQPVILVPHSNAGVLVPMLVAGLADQVGGCIFVDAMLPGRSGDTPVAASGMLAFLRGLATDGLLPRWTDWWDEDIGPLFPDEASRAAITAEQPRLPLAYFEQAVPVPAGWDAGPCAYVQFSPPYDDDAASARDRGWRVGHVAGGHLHMLADPAGVARVLAALAAEPDGWHAGARP
jgi:hypothetical protein